MKSFGAAAGLALLAGLSLAGCQAPSGPQGRSSFQILDPQELSSPAASDRRAASSDIEVDHIPGYAKGDLAPPVYPPEALAARAGPYVVYATVTIDSSGRVTGVARNLRGVTLLNRFDDSFFKAVRDATAIWSFSPAHNVYWQRVAEGDRKYIRTEALTETMDVKFTFEPSGEVR